MSAPDYAQYLPEDSSCVRGGVHRCENVREPRKRRTVFSIAFFEQPSPEIFGFQIDQIEKIFRRAN